jgi:hypothetical protein
MDATLQGLPQSIRSNKTLDEQSAALDAKLATIASKFEAEWKQMAEDFDNKIQTPGKFETSSSIQPKLKNEVSSEKLDKKCADTPLLCYSRNDCNYLLDRRPCSFEVGFNV